MHIQPNATTLTASRLSVLGCLLSAILLTGCGAGPDDPATVQGLKDLGVLVVPNVDGQVSTLNGLPEDPAKLTEAIELSQKLGSLKTIVAMEGVPLTDEHLAIIGKNGGLVEVSVNGAPVTDKGIAELTSCGKLESLSLVKTTVTTESMPLFAKMKKLNLLNINDTKIDGGFENLQQCKNLEWILIGGLNISDEEAAAISKIPMISHVTLSDTTKISDAGVKTLKSTKDCNVDFVANTPAVGATE